MRTRSVQLVTSWWVVCVWAAVSLATGLVSVVAVLQPAWYVRYSQIHAQDVQGVAFQVMVSSVGPLGYCRLDGVKQVTLDEEESHLGHVESSTVTAASPSPTLWTMKLTPSTEASEYSLETSHQDSSTPLPPTGATKSLFPTEVTQPTTPFHEVVQSPSPPADPDVSGNTSVNSNGGTPLESMDTTTTAATDNSGAVEANRSEEIPITTAENFSGDGPLEEDLKTKEHKSAAKIPGTPKEESNAPGIEVKSPRAGEEMGGGRGGRKREGKLARPSTPPDATKAAARKNGTEAIRGRRKKGKHRRRKKKYNRKRPRPREGGNTRGRSHGAPRPNQPLHHLLRSSLEDHEAPHASPLQQPHPKEKLVRTAEYRPRPPILYCSGVGGGVGSGSSAVWALVGVLYGVAGVVQVVVGVASLAMHLPHLHAHAKRYTFSAWLGNVQVAVVMSQGVALVLFPLGLGSPLARGECGGSSSVYWPGECSFGWSYMLGVVATTLAAYCPCLARLTVFRKYDYKEWDNINFF